MLRPLPFAVTCGIAGSMLLLGLAAAGAGMPAGGAQVTHHGGAIVVDRDVDGTRWVVVRNADGTISGTISPLAAPRVTMTGAISVDTTM